MSRYKQMLWDETMPLLRLVGEGARSFLHGQTTADFLGAKPNSFIRGCWLNTSGRVRAIFEARLVDDGVELLVLGGDFDEVMKGFDQVIFPADQVSLDSLQKIRRVQHLTSKQLDRFENVSWLLPDQLLPKILEEVVSATPLEFERWRMEHGLPIGKGELNAMNNPFELGLANLINFNKGCYLGQETIAKLSRIGQVKKQLMFVESDSNLLIGQTLSSSVGKKKIGTITASTRDEKIGSSFGLSILRREAFTEKEFYLDNQLCQLFIKLPSGFVSSPEVSLELT